MPRNPRTPTPLRHFSIPRVISRSEKRRCEPQTGDAYGLPFAFARSLDEAIGLLRQCTPVASVLGERFVSAFCAVKEAEYVEYARVISPWERRYLLLHV